MTTIPCPLRSHRRTATIWLAGGCALTALSVWLGRLSNAFPYGADPVTCPVLLVVAIGALGGAVYLATVWGLRSAAHTRWLLGWVIAVGVCIRAPAMLSTPILEDDWHRYLWDGAVVAHGFDPYLRAPQEVRDGKAPGVPMGLRDLARDAGPIVERINHAELRTIYPPVTEAAFAVAYWLRPWSLVAWRLVLGLFDVATLLVVAAVLRDLKRPSGWLAIYWWNPLVVKEIYNSGHMDMVAFPFALGAILLAMRNRHVLAAGVLALAVGAKGWPLVLLPLVVRGTLRRPQRLFGAVVVFVLIASGLAVPLAEAMLGGGSGVMNYARRWELNDALFKVFVWAAEFGCRIVGEHPGHGQWVGRLLAAATVATCVVCFAVRRVRDGADLCRRALLTVTALFLVSPTQYPWYGVWLVPFLAVHPRLSLLLLTPLLPLYYMRYYFDSLHMVSLFDEWFVWLEYVPVWYLLVREWLVGRRRRARPNDPGERTP